MAVVELADGLKVECEPGTKLNELVSGLEKCAHDRMLAAQVDGKVVDLSSPVLRDVKVRLLTFDDREGRQIYWHSAAHIMAQAVKRLFPEAKLAIGPAIEDGFYYDFDVPRPLTPGDLDKIEKEIKSILKSNYPFERFEVSKTEAKRRFEQRGEKYKVELIEEIPEESVISIYRQGEFEDLCTGPHVPSTGVIKHVKLLHVAGAYWRGDERRPMLQRIYGTAYETESQLAEHLQRLEEARRRDHRKLGRELDLFSMQEEAGPGLVFWHPHGAVVREIIEDFWRREHRRRGYEIVYSPHIAKLELWKISGHWDWYKENMYSPINVEGVEYLLKPMNCPFHILMYKSRTRSYRDLPLRWAELGTVYRYERSGVLHGLLRVRGFTQDDAHIFCTVDQLTDEIRGVLDLSRFMMKSFGFKDYEIMLSVREPNAKSKYIGDDEVWQAAESALVEALRAEGLSFSVAEGEAKFYGPAIDITLKDTLGRGWQGPTIQVDFNLPQRFEISYVGEDGFEHRPVMIHRTVLGSMERFLGTLIEHYAGAFPLWLSPEQVRVLPIADRHLDYARGIMDKLRTYNLRAQLDSSNEKIGHKIRDAQLSKVPYMLIVGDREQSNGSVSVRHRSEGDIGSMDLNDFIDRVIKERDDRRC